MSSRSARFHLLEKEVKDALEHLSGRDLKDIDTSATFFDLGFDSLLLTQASQSLRQKFGVKITFRQLLEDLVTIDDVAGYLDEHVPADQVATPVASPKSTPALVSEVVAGNAMDRIVQQQLQLMARQLELLQLAGKNAAPVIARLREMGVESSVVTAVPAPAEDITLPLPEAQKGLWLLSELHDDANRAYHLSLTLSLRGKLDQQTLSDAFAEVVERHGALRTTINPNGESQTIHAHLPPVISFYDYSTTPAGERDAAAAQHMEELENQLFPELRGPFYRVALFRLEPEQHYLLITFHHLIANGPSYLLFTEELASLYAEKVYQIPANLPPAVPFSEFIEQRESYAGTAASKEAEAFWIKQFQSGVPVLELPYDHPRPPEITHRGDRRDVILDPALTGALRKIGAAHRSSLFMILFAAYGALLHRLSGQDDLVVGVPFDSLIRVEGAGRNLVANTTNMLPLRSILYDGSTFIEYLHQINALILEASEHQDYFFGNLMRKLNLSRDSSRSLFFNVTFNRERGEFKKTWPDLEMSLQTEHVPSGSPRGIAMFDMYVNAAERLNGEILVECDHNTDLIDPETMERWLKHYKTLLEGIVADPDQPVLTLPLLSSAELQDLFVTGPSLATS
jgi:acyl carrier protein